MYCLRRRELIVLSAAEQFSSRLPQINSCMFNMAFARLMRREELIQSEVAQEQTFLPSFFFFFVSPPSFCHPQSVGEFSRKLVVGLRSCHPSTPKTLHASSFIGGRSSCPVSGTVTPEHSAAAKHLAPSPTVQMKNKHNLPL